MSIDFDDRPAVVTRDEAWELLDEAAHKWLGISADEFARRHDKGKLSDDARTMHVTSLLDLARQ
ncbi:hypothetical protein [Jiangella mangrovi]|uniref:Uncharacterized protein n=1 Tax=Jiangella mangrovi TaxID=1524084 RepID=A0A7W9LJD2_9ACTN|nr:hypothetical protein [Jiangella mangrovi]MBB5785995.1 hypothetical protein [Jiangella mangrovi]